ncbi:MFS transporter [Streptomyces sp. N2-109]|uniref:MFS transporter n=1 Tax=Streptomyces gossypii TaxID=2883101 RepID=A0ABT2JZ79_9ACTN|nr:MFS transporter [Streptomyces gossypii]MCT2593212.1 MFS transporter [Streptomyces gossypii]
MTATTARTGVPPEGIPPQGAPDRGRLLLAVILTVQFTVALDMSVLNVALPDIRHHLGFTATGLPWVVNAYALAFGGLMMLGGRIGDLAGRRRTLLAGLVLFGAASATGALAQEPWQLITARAVQGAGAAALAPVALALITVNYPAGPARSRALGLWGAAAAAGGAAGVLIGGLLTESAGWRSVMLINVPITLVTLLAARKITGDRRDGPAPRLDLGGALLVTAGTSALVLAVVRTETLSWGSSTTVATLALAALLLTLFVGVELRTAEPLLRMRLLTRRPVVAANVFMLLLASAQFAVFYFVSLYLQQVLEYGPAATGLAFLPFCCGIVVGSVTATRSLARLGARRVLVSAGALGAAGFGWFALVLTADGGFATAILGPSLLTSIGVGMSIVPLGTAATADVDPREAGMATGLINSSRQIGGSIGLAVLVTVSASVTGGHGGGADEALAAGYRAAAAVAGGLLMVATLLALLLMPPRRP